MTTVEQSGPVVQDALRRLEQLEQWVRSQGALPLATKAEVDEKIDVAIKTLTAIVADKPARQDGWQRSVLESKGIQDVASLSDSKTYRQWNKKLKNALDLVRPKPREKLELIERLTEEEIIVASNSLQSIDPSKASKRDAIVYIISNKHPHNSISPDAISSELESLDRDMWSILMSKATGEAEGKLEGCNQGEGLWGYLRIHLWFTKTTAQGKSLRRSAIMTPTRCKHEHEISSAIEKWEEKYRILKEEDKELDLPDSWKMTAIQAILWGEVQKHIEYRE